MNDSKSARPPSSHDRSARTSFQSLLNLVRRRPAGGSMMHGAYPNRALLANIELIQIELLLGNIDDNSSYGRRHNVVL